MCCLVFTLQWCACAILMCDYVYVFACMCTFSRVSIHVIGLWPVCFVHVHVHAPTCLCEDARV